MSTDELANFALLPTQALKPHLGYIHPERLPELAHLDSPAIEVMTDFTSRPPETITPSANAQSALQEMKLAKVKSLLVIDEDDTIIGHINARDIQGIKSSMVAREYGVPITELTVEMLMIPPENLPSLNIKNLQNARVGHIVKLIHTLGVYYVIVVETAEDGIDYVRGIFSISRISRQLGENLSGDLASHSVADITKRLDD